MSSQLSAVELLNLGDADRQKPELNKYWPEVLGISMGIGLATFLNFQTRRPLYSGLQKHVICAGALTGIFKYVQNLRDDYLAEKDAVYRHYVQLHPDEFQEPERKKIGDILEPWIPVR